MPIYVAEFTTNHMGNLNVLLRMVERAAAVGADLIKMQKKNVASFYSPDKLAAPYNSPYGQTYGDYRSLFEFGKDDFDRFDAKCREHGVEWFASAQDLDSLDFLLGYDLQRYKVASCNARNRDLLGEMSSRIPRDRIIVLSVAGSTLAEIEQALAVFPHREIWLQHCVARYPCPPEETRLGNVEALKRRFGSDRIRIGYSGHEEGFAATLVAVDLGAEVVERHFCLSRHSFVHHIECSLEPDEFRAMVLAVKTGRRSGRGCEPMPPEAYSTHFGMTRTEASFLLEQSYGKKYVGVRSHFVDEEPELSPEPVPEPDEIVSVGLGVVNGTMSPERRPDVDRRKGRRAA